MKCPVCFLEQKHYENERVHVCPYCDAILIYREDGYFRWDSQKWWIKYRKYSSLGAFDTEKEHFEFEFNENWILNNKYILNEKENKKEIKNRKRVEWVEGILPITALPGSYIEYEISDEKIKIQDHENLFVFKRIQ